MATENHNLSSYTSLPAVNTDWKIAIVKAKWNNEITDGLYDGAVALLNEAGIQSAQIFSMDVPGSYELPLGAQWALEKYEADGVICLGSIIRGETAHFDYVSQAVSLGIKDVMLDYNSPVIFGVLTDDNIEQARARSGGKHGNKGIEAAVTLLEMLSLRDAS